MPDNNWIIAGLVPFNDNALFTSGWLEEYFKNYGDHKPNGSEIYISAPTKKCVYDQYVNETEIMGIQSVDISIFYEIWNSMYPNCLLRPWVDVPGKCSTCYEIDCGRKRSTDKKVLKALQQCHQLHRAGLFMLERRA